MKTTTIFAFIALLASSCNSFDPDLGTVPFKCGATNPRCPDGYACVQSGASELCVVDGQDPGAIPDGGGNNGTFSCNNDSTAEINDSIGQATPTGIPNQSSARLVGLAICPISDIDIFGFNTPAGLNSTITASIELGNGPGTLRLEILGDTGAVLQTGMTDPLDSRKVTVQVSQAPPSEQFFARVSGDGVGENNYNIDISVTQ